MLVAHFLPPTIRAFTLTFWVGLTGAIRDLAYPRSHRSSNARPTDTHSPQREPKSGAAPQCPDKFRGCHPESAPVRGDKYYFGFRRPAIGVVHEIDAGISQPPTTGANFTMSQPFVYIPEANFQQTAYFNQAHSPYGSPFVPDGNFQQSPYSSYGGSLPPSPHVAGNTPLPSAPIAFPGMMGGPDPIWDSAYRRPRQNSWHGANPYANNNTLLFAPERGQHARSNSFTQATAPTVVAAAPAFYTPIYYQPPLTAPVIYSNWNPNSHSPWYRRFLNLPNQPSHKEVYIHPWLNGEAFRSDFLFNLALPNFAPLRVVGPNGETTFLGPEELSQPATYPSIYKLSMTCDLIPQWPVELVFNPSPNSPYAAGPMNTANLPPITVGDVLLTLYRELHKPITQYDWGGLSTSEAKEVRRAYMKRCKSAGPQGDVPLQREGVKRIDFLRKDVWFKGLVRKNDGLENLRLIVG